MWMSDNATQRVTVGRVGKAHGLAGDVSVELRTDEPELRFADGAKLWLVPADYSAPVELQHEVTVANSRFHSGRFLVRFDQATDRNGAESIRGMLIESEIDPTASPAASDEFYDRQLVGLAAKSIDGADLGEVVRVDHLPGQDYLIVRQSDSSVAGFSETMVPFVAEIVPTVDLDQAFVVVDAPPGLFEEVIPNADGDGASA